MVCGGTAPANVLDPETMAQAEAQKAINKSINKMIRSSRESAESKTKMLLLGAGESGKSTIFKQMQIINGTGYTKDELASFKWIIHRNVLDAIQILITQASSMGIQLEEANEDRAEQVQLWEGENLNPELALAIEALWADPGIQQTFDKRADFQLGDASKYFLDQVGRIAAADYVPIVDDVLRARVRTSGVVSKEFCIPATGTTQARAIELFDVGGQRSERRRWIHFFDHVNSLVFVAAISEYNQVLAEDASKNRLEEAMDLFEQIVQSHHFCDTSVYLFLNKRDLFEEKIKTIDPRRWFPDYTGGCDKDKCEAFFRAKFKERMQRAKNKSALYVHTTCATDTGNIRFVLDGIFKDEFMDMGISAKQLEGLSFASPDL